jgi:hypothetical protein
VRLGEEPDGGVEVPPATEHQEEGERQDDHQRGDEPGGADDYVPRGQEEVADRLTQLAANVTELLAEPLEDPTQPVLPGEPLEVLRRPLRRLGHSDDEVAQPPYLVDQQGDEDTRHEQQPHHQRQVNEQDGERAPDQPVTPLQPVDRGVEHRRQEEGDDEPADEGAYLPEQEEGAQRHGRGQDGQGHGPHHLGRRGANPHAPAPCTGRPVPRERSGVQTGASSVRQPATRAALPASRPST